MGASMTTASEYSAFRSSHNYRNVTPHSLACLSCTMLNSQILYTRIIHTHHHSVLSHVRSYLDAQYPPRLPSQPARTYTPFSVHLKLHRVVNHHLPERLAHELRVNSLHP